MGKGKSMTRSRGHGVRKLRKGGRRVHGRGAGAGVRLRSVARIRGRRRAALPALLLGLLPGFGLGAAYPFSPESTPRRVFVVGEARGRTLQWLAEVGALSNEAPGAGPFAKATPGASRPAAPGAAGLPRLLLQPELLKARLDAHPRVREARVRRLPGGRLLIGATPREAHAVAVLGEQRLLVDARGAAFAEAVAADRLPELLGLPAGRTRQPQDPNLAFGVALLKAAREAGLPQPSALWLGDRPEAELPALVFDDAKTRFTALLGGGQEIPRRLSRLARLLEARPPALLQAREIDLRFGDRLILRRDASRDAGAGARGIHRAQSGADRARPGGE